MDGARNVSARVLIILEDPTYDRYIVQPVVERLLRDIKKPKVRVDVLTDPRMGGVSYVFARQNWEKILQKYPMVDVFIVVVDSDCEEGRKEKLVSLRSWVQGRQAVSVGVLAIEEVEVWLLAGYVDKLSSPWKTVRAHCNPKEAFYQPFVESEQNRGVAGGRRSLMQHTLRNLRGLMHRCPEIRELRTQLQGAL